MTATLPEASSATAKTADAYPAISYDGHPVVEVTFGYIPMTQIVAVTPAAASELAQRLLAAADAASIEQARRNR